ncbi:Peptidase family M50 [uncultured archaeon]|nr:Peptidase family M50 [uncultured archaeon]
MGFAEVLLVFLVVSVFVTYLLKRYAKAESFFVVSLIRSKKPIGFFDSVARNVPFLDAFAKIGLILGFGAFAIDYLYGKDMPKAKRIGLFAFSSAALCSLLILVDLSMGMPFSKNLMIGSSFPLMVASFGLMGFAGFSLFSLALQAFDIIMKYLVGIRGCPGVAPLIPGVEIPRVPVTPPLHAWLSLLIILVVHEAMHGILGRRHGFAIKSTGIILFGFLPIGAFVEPDEAELKRARDESVLPFLAAGPMANLLLMLVAGLVLFAGMGISSAAIEHFYPGLTSQAFSGVKVLGVSESTSVCGSTYPSPAFGLMKAGDIIRKVDNVEITGPDKLYAGLQRDRGSEKSFLLDRNGSDVLVSMKPNEMGQFGFTMEPMRNESLVVPEGYKAIAFASYYLLDFIYWLFLLNFLVAVINFLPMHPFDGGRIGKIIFGQYFISPGRSKEESQDLVARFFMAAIFVLLLINALPLLF